MYRKQIENLEVVLIVQELQDTYFLSAFHSQFAPHCCQDFCCLAIPDFSLFTPIGNVHIFVSSLDLQHKVGWRDHLLLIEFEQKRKKASKFK